MVGPGLGSQCFMGTEFQFGKMRKFWSWMVGMAAQQCECNFMTLSCVLKNGKFGVPVVVQWLTNPTRNHEVAGSVPALAQWVNDPALP